MSDDEPHPTDDERDRGDERSSGDGGDYRTQLREHRAEKDRFFSEHPQSPIPPDDRATFDGLDYFSPDPDYRVTARVEQHPDPEGVVVETTAGNELRYERLATLHFELHGAERSLGAYRRTGEETGSLFVPFRDKTTGQQSYRGGRYMELTVEGSLGEVETLTLDFNLAYTPFCAYSETFDCPLPPEENWLETVVEAGEKDYEP